MEGLSKCHGLNTMNIDIFEMKYAKIPLPWVGSGIFCEGKLLG